MIKFMSTLDNGRKLLGIALSRKNLKLIEQGHPVHFNAEQMNLPELRANEIMILFGETEEEIMAEFKKSGAITGRTKVIVEKEHKH